MAALSQLEGPFSGPTTEALWGTRVSASTVSELNQKIYVQIEAWRNLPIIGSHAYVYLDGIWLKRRPRKSIQRPSASPNRSI